VATPPSDAVPESTMLAFLIADIRGYTRFTQEHGDEAAGELAGTFAAVTREVVTARGGTLLELRGDEALVVFRSPRQAVRSAVALQERFVAETERQPNRPLAVGIGIDMGEVVAVEDGYRGRALNLAARLCSAAGPGEILATGEVAHFAGTTEEFHYLDRPPLTAKGIEKLVATKRVLPVAGDPAQQLRALGAVPTPTRPARRDRRIVPVAIGCAAVLLANLLVVALRVAGGSETPAYAAGTLLLNLASGKPITTIPGSTIAAPGFPTYDGEHFWVLNARPSSFVEIDPHTGKVISQFASPRSAEDAPGDTYQPYTVVGDNLWVSVGDDVVQMDTRLGRTVGRLHLDQIVGAKGLTEGIAYGAGLLWVGRDVGTGQVVAINPRTKAVVHRFDDVEHHNDLAYADGTVWTTDYNGAAVINVSTGKVTDVADIDGTNKVIVTGAGFGWTTEAAKGVAYKIDPSGHVVASYNVGLGAGSASFADGKLWTANNDAGTATGIDAITGQVTTYHLGHPVGVVAAGAGALLGWLQPGESIEQIVDEQGGNVLRLFSQQGELGEDEPALNWNYRAFQIDYATCANLLNYPDKAGAAATLQPEVATSVPTPTNHGRTYTFTVRSGYEFSPPVDKPLTAETFRSSIERALSPKLGDFQPASFYVSDIAGEAAYRAGKANSIDGLRVHGDQMSITLTHPSPDFLKRISMPFFCPVPDGTPVARGAEVQGGSPFGGGGSIPSAGPYYVAAYFNEGLVLLKRNPNYPTNAPRQPKLDAIVLREGVDASVAVADVKQGRYDGIVSSGRDGSPQPFDPLLAPSGAVAERYGQTGDIRYVLPPLPGVGFLALNAGRPPFDDPVIRRAAALAIDRASVAVAAGQVPAERLLPVALTGGQVQQPPAPDQTAARRLLHGRHPTLTLGTFPGCDVCGTQAQAVRAQLDAAGFHVVVKEVAGQSNPYAPGDDLNMLLSGDGAVVPDPASFVVDALQHSVPAGWLPGDVSRAVDRLSRLSGAHRENFAAAVAKMADLLFPVIVEGDDVQPELFRSTVGCRIFTPASYGVDLAALCRS
jgi:class 3 adenylate cyclase/ABC-type transport system substrate-binding protein